MLKKILLTKSEEASSFQGGVALTTVTTIVSLSSVIINTNPVEASSKIDQYGDLRGNYNSHYVVRSPHGTLNCNPGPYISRNPTMIYPNGSKLSVYNVVYGQYDSPWILTQHNCYVRANVKYLY